MCTWAQYAVLWHCDAQWLAILLDLVCFVLLVVQEQFHCIKQFLSAPNQASAILLTQLYVQRTCIILRANRQLVGVVSLFAC